MVTHFQCANAVRVLAMDAVEKARSGHPGMPMGMSDIATVLWQQFLRCNPKNPTWINRDRFVLSNGHGAMLLYAVLHLTGYAVSLADLKNFRQLHSITPGHPEYGHTPGVETTTGPLGQGLANGVGFALAESMLAAQFNRPGFPIIDHFTYVFVGDGCLMEGISHEACALAGTHKLGKLIVFWDDNHISIDGPVSGWFTDDTPLRFKAYDWQVIEAVDGHDPEAIAAAITAAQHNQQQPTLICCRTQIGFGSEKFAGTAASHGAPLGQEEGLKVRQQLNWPHPPFEIPVDVAQAFDATERGAALELDWQQQFERYQQQYPALAAALLQRLDPTSPAEALFAQQQWLQAFSAHTQPMATRAASGMVLEQLQTQLPALVGGSADLSGSNNTRTGASVTYDANTPTGNYLHYGVREFGMAAIMNGLALYGGFIPYGGTFLVFSDYARNAIRLSALMRQKVIYVLTHDSIGLGEDGPTHQPIEHLGMLRLTPDLLVWRPCDTTETALAWQQAVLYQGPSCLVLSRQALPPQSRSQAAMTDMQKGGYVLFEPPSALDAILIATGSEVHIAVASAEQLLAEGVMVRVVSMPCVERFIEQDAAYQAEVLPSSIKARVAVEAGATDTWYRWVGDSGVVLGIDRFGQSAPADQLFEYYGLTVSTVTTTVQRLLDTAVS